MFLNANQLQNYNNITAGNQYYNFVNGQEFFNFYDKFYGYIDKKIGKNDFNFSDKDLFYYFLKGFSVPRALFLLRLLKNAN